MPPSTVFSFIPIHEPFLPNFGLVEHSLSGTVFFGPVEVPLIEIQLYLSCVCDIVFVIRDVIFVIRDVIFVMRDVIFVIRDVIFVMRAVIFV